MVNSCDSLGQGARRLVSCGGHAPTLISAPWFVLGLQVPPSLRHVASVTPTAPSSRLQPLACGVPLLGVTVQGRH